MVSIVEIQVGFSFSKGIEIEKMILKKIKIKSAAKLGGWHWPTLEKNQKTTA
ncbi:MAG: hypothetical protein IPP11_00025 [Chitinophagaceae bacterium]|nr:hypothetical protein [Chitinophagaceae bacterium]